MQLPDVARLAALSPSIAMLLVAYAHQGEFPPQSSTAQQATMANALSESNNDLGVHNYADDVPHAP